MHDTISGMASPFTDFSNWSLLECMTLLVAWLVLSQTFSNWSLLECMTLLVAWLVLSQTLVIGVF